MLKLRSSSWYVRYPTVLVNPQQVMENTYPGNGKWMKMEVFSHCWVFSIDLLYSLVSPPFLPAKCLLQGPEEVSNAYARGHDMQIQHRTSQQRKLEGRLNKNNTAAFQHLPKTMSNSAIIRLPQNTSHSHLLSRCFL